MGPSDKYLSTLAYVLSGSRRDNTSGVLAMWSRRWLKDHTRRANVIINLKQIQEPQRSNDGNVLIIMSYLLTVISTLEII